MIAVIPVKPVKLPDVNRPVSAGSSMRIVNDLKKKNQRKMGKWRIWFRQLGILMRKNFLLQIRRPISTIFSCLVGLILAFLLIGRNESKKYYNLYSYFVVFVVTISVIVILK